MPRRKQFPGKPPGTVRQPSLHRGLGPDDQVRIGAPRGEFPVGPLVGPQVRGLALAFDGDVSLHHRDVELRRRPRRGVDLRQPRLPVHQRRGQDGQRRRRRPRRRAPAGVIPAHAECSQDMGERKTPDLGLIPARAGGPLDVPHRLHDIPAALFTRAEGSVTRQRSRLNPAGVIPAHAECSQDTGERKTPGLGPVPARPDDLVERSAAPQHHEGGAVVAHQVRGLVQGSEQGLAGGEVPGKEVGEPELDGDPERRGIEPQGADPAQAHQAGEHDEGDRRIGHEEHEPCHRHRVVDAAEHVDGVHQPVKTQGDGDGSRERAREQRPAPVARVFHRGQERDGSQPGQREQDRPEEGGGDECGTEERQPEWRPEPSHEPGSLRAAGVAVNVVEKPLTGESAND